MKIPFRNVHLLQFLNEWNLSSSLDSALHKYFKEHHALGSKDRKEIREQIYFIVRYLRALDYPESTSSWEERVDKLGDFQVDESWPEQIQVSFPDFLYAELKKDWNDQALEIAKASNSQAPITVRTNGTKITRDALLKELAKDYPVEPTKVSPDGITFLEPVRFDTISMFNKGFFEVQDEGSQLVASQVAIKPKETVLDYCAGSGGKALAIAPKMMGQGSLFLHDVRSSALQEARKRMNKAGVQNVQFVLPKHKVDWVLVDVPCSGTGTLRRSPEMKWRLTESDLSGLVLKQREIFEKGLSYLKKGGRIVYATCSILARENREQVDYFLSKYPIQLEGDILTTFPKVKEMDGFFAATFRLNGDALSL